MLVCPVRPRRPMLLPLWAALLYWLLAQSAFADAVDAGQQSITIALTQEPPTLNSLRSTDLVSGWVLGHVLEGLVRYDQRGRLVPGQAESWEQSEREIRFKLRPHLRWSDGSHVTADDFVFAWRQLLDPVAAAPYASLLYALHNARAIHQGKLPVEQLGVTAPDAQTLVVKLEVPTPWFLSLLVHPATYPVPRAFYHRHGERYGTEAATLLSNGPFRLEAWTHGASLTLLRNPGYWQPGQVGLARIQVGYITEDNRTHLNLFRDQAIALARLDTETVQEASRQQLRVKTFVSGGLAFLQFNLRRPALSLPLRRAVQALVDPQRLVNNVIAIPGYKPAQSFFPSWLGGAARHLRDEHPPTAVDHSRGAVDRWVAEARQAAGGELPALSFLTVASPTGLRIAEYLQGLLQRELGLALRIDSQIIKQYLAKANQGDFDLALASWYPDFDDVLTYADLMGSWNPNNRGHYVSASYDADLRGLQESLDPVRRMTLAARLQERIRVDVPVVPLMETGSAYLVHPRLKGVVRRVIGPDPDYTFARVVAD